MKFFMALAWGYALSCGLGIAQSRIGISGELVHRLTLPENAPRFAHLADEEGPDGRVVRQEFDFHVTSEGCRSLLTSIQRPTGNIYESAVDNETIYCLYTFNTSTGRVTAAEIMHRQSPRDDASSLNYLWLAYGSHCRFAPTNNAGRLHPVWRLDGLDAAAAAYQLPAFWNLLSEGGLPAHIVYLNEGFMRPGTPDKQTWPPPFDRGFTNAVYDVKASTNLNGTVLPLEWTFTRYGLGKTGSGNFGLKIISQTEARVTKIAEEPVTESLTPNFTGIISVADTRFARSNPAVGVVSYSITNGAWPTEKMNEVPTAQYLRVSRMQQKLTGISEAEAWKLPVRRTVFLALVSGSTLALAVLVSILLRRPTKL